MFPSPLFLSTAGRHSSLGTLDHLVLIDVFKQQFKKLKIFVTYQHLNCALLGVSSVVLHENMPGNTQKLGRESVLFSGSHLHCVLVSCVVSECQHENRTDYIHQLYT